jgi:hypothetical protein
MTANDISPDWHGSTRRERRIVQELLAREKTPAAIIHFSRVCHELTDYWYWYLLGTLWVSYSGHCGLAHWRRLLSSRRPNRATSLMKPSEVRTLAMFPERFRACRAHRAGECDWIAYTIDRQIAARFAVERGVEQVIEYGIRKEDVVALFMRRGEAEVIVLNRQALQLIGPIDVLVWPEAKA